MKLYAKDKDVIKIFDTENGKKIRFSYNDDAVYEKASYPELVDLIISNKCNYGCKFCYRGCTPDNGEASLSLVKTYVEALRSIGVFEVAIGGGDLFIYPELEELCSFATSCETIVLNTTLKFNANIDMKKTELILKSFKGIAFSINTLKEMQDFVRKYPVFYEWNKHISIQMVPEIIELSELKEIVNLITENDINVTFLGVKKTGRCVDNKYDSIIKTNREDLSWFESTKKDTIRIGVDTQFLKNFPVLKAKLEPWMYTEEEGKFSCCIDAVENNISASSFTGEKIKLDFNDLKNSIIAEFKKF